MRHLIYFTLFILFCVSAKAQEAKIEEEETIENKSAFEKMLSDRAFPGTSNQNFGKYSDVMQNYKLGMPQQLTANWTNLATTGTLYDDVGRANTITFDTINAGRYYVCTAHSGVWVTNNNGASYTPITESLPTQSTTALVIDPSNTDILYLATGTHQMDMPRNSMGVFKSVDGGQSWNATGLSFSAASGNYIGDIIINPKNPNSVLVGTSNGLYRTFDGGSTWNIILADTVSSIRFKPGDTTTVYAAGTHFYKSIDSGNNFAISFSGLINNYQWKYENYTRTIAAFPNVVYFITAGGWANPSFNPWMYIYKSVDSGNTFSVLDSLGAEPCIQVDCSQSTLDKFIAGYRTTWKKNDTGSPFVQLTQWYSPMNSDYMHADLRGVTFDPFNDNIIYFCNDGGVYKSVNNGTNILNQTGNMQLAHMYSFATSTLTDYKILVSTLDVYPYLIGPSGITQSFPQFVEAFASHMNPLNDSIFCMSMYNPGFTVDNGNNFFGSTHPLIGNAFMTPENFQYSDCDQNVCYFTSYNDIFKSIDYGASFGNLAQTTYNPPLSFIRNPEGINITRANPRYMYVYYIDSVYVTTDGTSNFTNISAGLPIGQAAVSSMVVDPANENNAWIAFSGYSAGNKVFYTNNAGQTWTNISAGLPNIPVNILACQKGIPGALYAGTDGGVFYIDNTFSSWQYYNTNLPNVMVTDLEIQYNLNKLRASTFGRGVWETDLFQPTPVNYMLPPVAIFTSVSTVACPNELINFSDNSCGTVDSVHWIFPGGTPSFSNTFNTSVSYASAGNYDVTLIAYNSGGSDTLTISDYIEIASAVSLPYYEPIADLNAFVLPSGAWTTEVNFDGATWNRGWWTDGSSGTGDDFIYYDNFFRNLNGQEERFVFPLVNLTGTLEPKLFFYRSYARRDAVTNDTLIIYVKPCGSGEVMSYKKGGAQLANIPGFYSANYWIPSQPSDWMLDSLDLTSFAGQAVTISFSDKGYGGQLLYIDEFRVMETHVTGLPEYAQATVSLFPNPATDVLNIRSDRELNLVVTVNDITGRILSSTTMRGRDAVIDIQHLSNGIYFVKAGDRMFKFEKRD